MTVVDERAALTPETGVPVVTETAESAPVIGLRQHWLRGQSDWPAVDRGAGRLLFRLRSVGPV